MAFEKVRNTTRFGCSARSGTTERPENSWYASSTTTRPCAAAHSRATCSGASTLPVGLLGEQTTVRVGASAALICTSASGWYSSSGPSGAGTISPPRMRVSSAYSVNVGSGTITRVPGATVTRNRAWMSSLDPLPARMPSGFQPAKVPSASSSSWGSKSG